MKTEEDIFRKITGAFNQKGDFDSFLSQKLNFDGRSWTVGQFLYKYFYDRVQDFIYQAKDHFNTLTTNDKAMAQKIKFLFENNMVGPKTVFEQIQTGTLPDADMFDGNREKEAFYRELFAGKKRSVSDNPCYWTPISQFQTRYIESRLFQMGMNDKQVRALMVHCETEKEKAEAFYRGQMPAQFIHNSRVPPAKMEGGCIRTKPRTDDQFLNLQKFCFVAPEGSFHSGLPMQEKEIDFMAWPRFSQKISAFQMTMNRALDKISDSYNYRIDMSQKDDIYPVIPLWGGTPQEWIAKKNLSYLPNVEKETFKDLLKQGKQIYIIPDKEDWKNWIRDKEHLSDEEAGKYLSDLSEQYPGRVIRLDKNFEARLSLHRQVQRIREGADNEQTPRLSEKISMEKNHPQKTNTPSPHDGR